MKRDPEGGRALQTGGLAHAPPPRADLRGVLQLQGDAPHLRDLRRRDKVHVARVLVEPVDFCLAYV